MRKSKMNPLILWRLKNYCRKHQLDPEHIDYTLSEEENMLYLRELSRDFGPDIDRWLPELDRYLEEQRKNFLQYYMDAAKRGQTLPVNMGPPVISTKFSFADIMGSQHGRT